MARPGFYFLICPDGELIQERLAGLLSEHRPGPDQEFERRAFWADEGLAPRFWEDLTLGGLFARPKALVVRQAQLLDAAAWDSLSGPLSGFISHAWPLFCLEVDFDRGQPKLPRPLKRQKYFEFAKKKGWVWESQGLTQRSMSEWLSRWAADRGLAFAPGIRERLAQALPLDAGAARREMDKIHLSLTPGQAVGPEAAALLTHSTELDIFAFIDALQRGSAPVKVWQTVFLSQQAEEGSVFRFLSMFLREARIMWQIRCGEFTGRMPPAALQAKEALARRLGPRGIARIFDLAMEAEMGVKTGERRPDQALDMFVAGFSRLVAGQGARPGMGKE